MNYCKKKNKKILEKCTFAIKIPSVTEKVYKHLISDSTYMEKIFQLPKDTISDNDISEFFSKLVFAVGQPNEKKLFGIVEKKMIENQGFNLISSEKNELFKKIIEWLKEKEGTYLTSKDCKIKIENKLK
jgi:hypothetical protein